MTAEAELPVFYETRHAFEAGWEPDQRGVFQAARDAASRYGWRPAADDQVKTGLVIIDGQRDFCFPSGSLYVGGADGEGAMRDNDRLARMILRESGRLTQILPTFDTHRPFQIFFSSFWLDQDGQAIPPHSVITAADIQAGKACPAPWMANITGMTAEDLKACALHYCRSLEESGKYALYIWPEHCILGSMGHALAGVLHAARLYHAWGRQSSNDNLLKGDLLLTENYSVFSPEVLADHKGNALGQRDNATLDRLLRGFDALVFAGQAGSHCVRSSLLDLLDEIQARDPALARKCYVMTDCMSPVVVRDGQGEILADFSGQQQDLFDRMSGAGMHLVTSETPMEAWPDFPRPR